MDAVFAKHKLDAVVAITGGPAWLIDLVNGDTETGGSSQLAAVSGYPSITVPAGYALGLPIGLSFIGPRLERAHPDQAGVCLRADNEGEEGAAVLGDGAGIGLMTNSELLTRIGVRN